MPRTSPKASLRLDAVVVGGGPAGLVLAAALAHLDLRIALVERAPFPPQLLPAFDGRTTAIAWQGYRFLQRIGIWPQLARLVSPIDRIRITDTNSPHVLDFDSAELGLGPFGQIVENRHLRGALLAQLRRSPNVTILNPASVAALDTSGALATVTLDDGRQLQAPLVAAADGRNSPLRQMLGIDTFDIAYDQQALVCTIQGDAPHGDVALEHFLPEGPFAVLPMQNNSASIVWSAKPATVQALLALDEADFLQAISQAGAAYMGNLKLVSDRFAYPLSLRHARAYTAPHVALIGEAAHAIHPIAGQGFNLGLRDIECIYDLIVAAHARGLRADDASVLGDYEKLRRRDNQTMAAATDILDRLFSTDFYPLARTRQWGLTGVAMIPPLKRFFMRRAMGHKGKAA